MKPHDSRHDAYNFVVDFGAGPVGAFSEVSGLLMEVSVTDVRGEEDAGKRVRKIPGIHKTTDVTLKRGLFDQQQLTDWMEEVRSGRAAKRTVWIRLQDEARNTVAVWKLKHALPIKVDGPTLSGKGNDVAIEELVFRADGVVVEQPCKSGRD
jgi:phage tail-like protein